MRKRLLIICLLISMSAVFSVDALERYVPDLHQTFLFKGDKVVELEDDVRIESLEAADYRVLISDSEQIGKYSLLQNELGETPVYCIDSGLPGATMYVVAGTHGDERAAWYAASLLAGSRIDAGKLYVLPQANILGCEQDIRTVDGSSDLNRAYPGNAEGDVTQRLANAIFKDIQRVQPDLLIDLHEAAFYSSHLDFMGNKLIFTNLDGIETLFFNLLSLEREDGLGQAPFDAVSPGIAASLNRVATELLHVPVITVETFRGFSLSQRIQDQVDVVLYCLEYFDMLKP